MQRLPSCKSLKEAFGKTAGLNIRKLLDGRTQPSIHSDVESWHQQCYNLPSHTESVMCAVNQLLEGHGVEPLSGDGVDNDHDLYYGRALASYVNMGDPYTLTVLCDHTRDDTFYLCTWGTWLELYERRHAS